MGSQTWCFCCCSSGRDFDPLNDVCFTVLRGGRLVFLYAKPLFWAMTFSMRRRDGLDMSLLNPLRPSFKNHRFCWNLSFKILFRLHLLDPYLQDSTRKRSRKRSRKRGVPARETCRGRQRRGCEGGGRHRGVQAARPRR